MPRRERRLTSSRKWPRGWRRCSSPHSHLAPPSHLAPFTPRSPHIHTSPTRSPQVLIARALGRTRSVGRPLSPSDASAVAEQAVLDVPMGVGARPSTPRSCLEKAEMPTAPRAANCPPPSRQGGGLSHVELALEPAAATPASPMPFTRRPPAFSRPVRPASASAKCVVGAAAVGSGVHGGGQDGGQGGGQGLHAQLRCSSHAQPAAAATHAPPAPPASRHPATSSRAEPSSSRDQAEITSSRAEPSVPPRPQSAPTVSQGDGASTSAAARRAAVGGPSRGASATRIGGACARTFCINERVPLAAYRAGYLRRSGGVSLGRAGLTQVGSQFMITDHNGGSYRAAPPASAFGLPVASAAATGVPTPARRAASPSTRSRYGLADPPLEPPSACAPPAASPRLPAPTLGTAPAPTDDAGEWGPQDASPGSVAALIFGGEPVATAAATSPLSASAAQAAAAAAVATEQPATAADQTGGGTETCGDSELAPQREGALELAPQVQGAPCSPRTGQATEPRPTSPPRAPRPANVQTGQTGRDSPVWMEVVSDMTARDSAWPPSASSAGRPGSSGRLGGGSRPGAASRPGSASRLAPPGGRPGSASRSGGNPSP